MNKIPNGMFYGCSSLSNVELPSGTQRIGDYAFMGCTNLTSVTVNNDAPLTIGRYAFNGCESLNSIPANVATIADYAFAGCDGMTNMTLNATVDSIGSCAFADCTALTSIYNKRGIPLTISPSVFKDITQSNVKLFVPSSSAYEKASVWKEFKVAQEILKKSKSLKEFLKELQNSQDKDVNIFNINGQKVKDVVPGQIYIINGQKIYIKK
jgi:hypothetical protein